MSETPSKGERRHFFICLKNVSLEKGKAIQCLRKNRKAFNHILIGDLMRNQYISHAGPVLDRSCWATFFQASISKGGDISDFDKERVLISAIQYNQLGAVEGLREIFSPDEMNRILPDEVYSTPLTLAVRWKSSSALVSYLVKEMGADLDTADGDGWSPLATAVHQDNPEALVLLLQLGADPNQTMNIKIKSGNL